MIKTIAMSCLAAVFHKLLTLWHYTLKIKASFSIQNNALNLIENYLCKYFQHSNTRMQNATHYNFFETTFHFKKYLK